MNIVYVLLDILCKFYFMYVDGIRSNGVQISGYKCILETIQLSRRKIGSGSLSNHKKKDF